MGAPQRRQEGEHICGSAAPAGGQPSHALHTPPASRSMVIDVSKKYFPQMAVGFSDPRVKARHAGQAGPSGGTSAHARQPAAAGVAPRAPQQTRTTARRPPAHDAQVHVCDGIQFVQDAAPGTYDVIVVDSSDPVGPAEVLFQKVKGQAGREGGREIAGLVVAGDLCAQPPTERPKHQRLRLEPALNPEP